MPLALLSLASLLKLRFARVWFRAVRCCSSQHRHALTHLCQTTQNPQIFVKIWFFACRYGFKQTPKLSRFEVCFHTPSRIRQNPQIFVKIWFLPYSDKKKPFRLLKGGLVYLISSGFRFYSRIYKVYLLYKIAIYRNFLNIY